MSKTQSIKLSVALITYNHELYLTKALDGILEQIHDYPFEIVISDDCSTDGTRKIIDSYFKKYPDIIRPLLHTKNMGVSKNYLFALQSCKGEYIATLDGDDFWTEPDKLRRQISFLDDNPNVVLSCHRCKHLYEGTQQLIDDPHTELFKDKPQGFEFDQTLYFEHWVTRTLTVVFRKNALNITQLEARRHSWDVVIFWMILSNGKGYAHNFFGGTYLINSNGVWSGSDELKQTANYYLIGEEMLKHEPNNLQLKKYFEIWQNKIRFLVTKDYPPLDLAKIKNKNFTIISDDEWGGEVYKAFNLQELSPLIGIKIFKDDFIELAGNLKSYLSKPLHFIRMADARHGYDFNGVGLKEYPIALLGDKVELHFVAYTSAHDAEKKWNERVSRINWDNLFLKMDISREINVPNAIEKFESVKHVYANSACFLNAFHKLEIGNHPEKKSVTLINNWNPEIDVLFPLSLHSFNLIGWLNGENGTYTNNNPFTPDIFDLKHHKNSYYLLRYDHHYFVKFAKGTIDLLDSYFPNSITVALDEDTEYAIVNYNKSGLDHFRLTAADETLPTCHVNVFLDLNNKKDRHVFILLRGNKNHKLRIDFVPRDRDGYDFNDIHLNVKGTEQEIPEEFEWMHFDFSSIDESETDDMLGTIKSFCFYVNPEEDAAGVLEIIAFFVGSIEEFEKRMNNNFA